MQASDSSTECLIISGFYLLHAAVRTYTLREQTPILQVFPTLDYLSVMSGIIPLERLPAYAPDLNPDEGTWQQLKDVKLRTLC